MDDICQSTLSPRQSEIASAARALIAERGFEGLRTRDIADRVGINVATLHYHVPTKASLVALVAQSMRDDFMRQSDARPRQHLSPLACLECELAEFRELLTDRPDLLLVLSELVEKARRDASVAESIHPLQRRWRSQFVAILDAGRADGSMRADLDAEAAASIFVGALSSYARQPDAADMDGFDRLASELIRSISAPHAR